jgi:hypothetical protein
MNASAAAAPNGHFCGRHAAPIEEIGRRQENTTREKKYFWLRFPATREASLAVRCLFPNKAATNFGLFGLKYRKGDAISA